MSKKTRKIFQNLSAVLCLCLVLVAMPGGVLANGYSFAGSGTESDPYIITTADQLFEISSAINGTGSENYPSSYIELANDIDMDDSNAIEERGISLNKNYPTIDSFSGVFDGKGYSIKNMSANYPSPDSLSIEPMISISSSLFGELLSGGEVKNLTLDDVNINSQGTRAASLVYTIRSGAVVSNVSSTGTINGHAVGGIAFQNFGSILSCKNYADIDSSDNIAGGIVAENYGYIEGCSNKGDISGYRVGGLVGSMKSPSSIKSVDTYEILAIVNSENHGSIYGEWAGGLVSSIESGTILNCYNAGNVAYDRLDTVSLSGADPYNGYLGGLVAFADYSIGYSTVGSTSVMISNSYNAGSIEDSSEDCLVGSLVGVGSTFFAIDNCYFLESDYSAIGESVELTSYEPATAAGSLASFADNSGVLTPLEGHEIIGDETKLINALNTWVREQDPDDYSYWGALAAENAGYPDFIDAYTVTYDGNGGLPATATQTKRPGLTYGQGETGLAAVLPTVARTGYDFAGWYNSTVNAASYGSAGKLAADTVITEAAAHSVYAGWRPRTDTVYKVEHYQQKVFGGTEYVLKETKTYRGTTAATVNAAAMSYTGYAENTSHTGRLASSAVAADGSLVLKLYYDRVPADVTYTLNDSNSGVQSDNLDKNVRISDEDRQNSQEITVYLKVEDLQENTIAPAVKDKAKAELAAKGHDLLDVFDISVFMRIVRNDDSVWEGKVPNEDLVGKITVRIPIPDTLKSKENLAIAFVDDEGNIELYETKKVVVGGIDYLEFETDHFSMYAIVQRDVIPLADDELTKTGEQGSVPLLPAILLLCAIVLGIKKKHQRGIS